jgi:hypothetical protein
MPASMMNRKWCIQNRTYYAVQSAYPNYRHGFIRHITLWYFLSESMFLILLAVHLRSMNLILFTDKIKNQVTETQRFYRSMPDYKGCNAWLKCNGCNQHLENKLQCVANAQIKDIWMREKNLRIQCLNCFNLSLRHPTSWKSKQFVFRK